MRAENPPREDAKCGWLGPPNQLSEHSSTPQTGVRSAGCSPLGGAEDARLPHFCGSLPCLLGVAPSSAPRIHPTLPRSLRLEDSGLQLVPEP